MHVGLFRGEASENDTAGVHLLRLFQVQPQCLPRNALRLSLVRRLPTASLLPAVEPLPTRQSPHWDPLWGLMVEE